MAIEPTKNPDWPAEREEMLDVLRECLAETIEHEGCCPCCWELVNQGYPHAEGCRLAALLGPPK
jgi:hypothetical protein